MEAGYTDSAWAVQDPDLAVLRERPGFDALTLEMGLRAGAAQDAEGRAEYLPQTRMGSLIVVRPPSFDPERTESYPLVLFLHGRGGTADGAREIATRLAPTGAFCVFPDAPYAMAGEGFEYWPRAYVQGDDPGRLVDVCAMNSGWYADIVGEISRRFPVDPDRVFLIGFSQGAAMAYAAGLEHPELFAGVAPLGGWIPEQYLDGPWFTRMAEAGTALFIGHGEEDQGLPLARAEEAAGRAREAGIPVTLRIYPVGHEIPPEMTADLVTWINELGGRNE